jgi:hypothetical protein
MRREIAASLRSSQSQGYQAMALILNGAESAWSKDEEALKLSSGRTRVARFASGGIVLTLMLLYFIAPDARIDFTVFDARDAESYLALARALASGLGYTRSLDPQFYIPHATWPPGLPLLLTPVAALAGMPVNLLIVKCGMIAYGALGILLAHLYAGRLSPSAFVRVGMPLMLALDPYYWHFSRLTLSEMPTVVWALVALLLVDIAWSKRVVGMPAAFGIGIAAGFGMLIRGSFFGAFLLPLVYLWWRRGEREARRRWLAYLGYAAGFVLPFLAWHVRNSFIDRSALGPDGINQLAMILKTLPIEHGAPIRSAGQILADMGANLSKAIRQIPNAVVPGSWAAGTALGAAAPWAAALLSLAALLISFAAQRNQPLIVLYGSMAALDLFYAYGAMVRLWVPVTALAALTLPMGAERLRLPPWAGGVFAAALAVSTAVYAWHVEEQPYRDPRHAALAALFEKARSTPIQGNVLTPHPQAFELVTGHFATMTVPGIGVEPAYSAVVLPPGAWDPKRLAGHVVLKNKAWGLVALDAPMTLAEIQPRIVCTGPMDPAFAILAGCPIF